MAFDEMDCPLCMEPMELDDMAFYPCSCEYQICRFCWSRILNEENGLCPACRKPYNSEKPAAFKPISDEELAKMRKDKKSRDQQKKQRVIDSRRHLSDVRVVQRNLLFVIGIPLRLADHDILKGQDYFGKYGKVYKIAVNRNAPALSSSQSAGAYITYCKSDDAIKAIFDLNKQQIDGRTLKVSLGTTKYCSSFLKGTQCTKHECMYLHEIGEDAASFTKEDMQQGKHTDYENQLIQNYLQTLHQHDTTSSSNTIATSSEGVNCAASCSTTANGVNRSQRGAASATNNNGKQKRTGRRNNNNAIGGGRGGRSERLQTSANNVPASTNDASVRHEQHSTTLPESDSSWTVTSAENESTQSAPSNVHINSTNETTSGSSASALLQGLGMVGPLDSGIYCNSPFSTSNNNNSLQSTVLSELGYETVRPSYATAEDEGSHLQHHHAALAGLGMSWTTPSAKDSVDTEHGRYPPGNLNIWGGSLSAVGGGEDDDLDFDPFRESQLGLAEQMETEARAAATFGLPGLAAAAYQQMHCQHPSLSSIHSSQMGLNLPPGLSLPPGFEGMPFPPITDNSENNPSAHHQLMNARSLFGGLFTTNNTHSSLSQIQAQRVYSANLNPTNDTTFQQQQQQHRLLSSVGSGDYLVKDILRNMCPDANISYGSGLNSGAVGYQTQQQMLKERASSNNHLTWQEDPAIVRSGQVHQSSSIGFSDTWAARTSANSTCTNGAPGDLYVPSPEASTFLEQFIQQCSSSDSRHSQSILPGSNGGNSSSWSAAAPGFQSYHYATAVVDENTMNQ